MHGSFQPGAVLDWDNFQFSDGEQKDKLLIVLGAKKDHDVLLVLTTSQQHYRAMNPGCHAVAGYFHIQKGTEGFFRKETWVLLSRPVVASCADIVKAGIEKRVRVAHNLSRELTSAVANCLRKGLDVSERHLRLL